MTDDPNKKLSVRGGGFNLIAWFKARPQVALALAVFLVISLAGILLSEWMG